MLFVTSFLAIAAGLVLLTAGGELMLRGAVAFARLFRVSPMLIGLTVVSAATSAPELVVTVLAAFEGSPDLGVGNIVGSNIFNTLVVVGLCGVLYAFRPPQGTLLRDGSVLLFSTLAYIGLAHLGVIGSVEGSMLVILLGLYIFYGYYQERRAGHTEPDEETQELLAKVPPSLGEGLTFVVGGAGCLIFGADLLVDGSVTIARAVGVSEAVIGLTLVAFGTSLPELAASVMAALRRHSAIALGNVIGSNLFNILGIGGVLSILVPIQVPSEMLAFDLWVLMGSTLVLIAILALKLQIGKLIGFSLLTGYLGFLVFQFL